MDAFTSMVMDNGKRGHTSHQSSLIDKRLANVKVALEHCCPEIHQPYRNVGGGYTLPIVVVENQCDQQKTAYVRNQITLMAKEVRKVIPEIDTELLLTVAPDVNPQGQGLSPRAVPWAAKKWLLPHDGTLVDRALRKITSRAITFEMADMYEHGDELRSYLTQVESCKADQGQVHDMCDAFLEAMAEVLRNYAKWVKLVLGRRRPHERRSKYAVLTPEQLNHGTIITCGIDPGLVYAGLCVIEFVGMKATPDPEEDPEPMFRILRLQAINLDTPLTPRFDWRPTRGPDGLYPIMSLKSTIRQPQARYRAVIDRCISEYALANELREAKKIQRVENKRIKEEKAREREEKIRLGLIKPRAPPAKKRKAVEGETAAKEPPKKRARKATPVTSPPLVGTTTSTSKPVLLDLVDDDVL